VPPRPGPGYGAARHSQPKTDFDKQPAGSAPGGVADAVWAVYGLDTRACLAASPKLNGTISKQRFTDGGVSVHGLLLFNKNSCHKTTCHKKACQAIRAPAPAVEVRSSTFVGNLRGPGNREVKCRRATDREERNGRLGWASYGCTRP
jgi:hypothetical protein